MKKQLLLAIILFAAIIFATVFMVKNGPTPAKKTIEDTVQQVTAISLQPVVFSPTIHGYGEARPDKTWTALTRVAGTIREISPVLQNGKFIRKGDLIARIDDTELRLALDKAKADVDRINAEIAQYTTRSEGLAAQLAILKKILELNRKNLERNRALRESDSISELQLEQEELTVLQQENTLASLQSEINLIPNQRDAYQAQLDAAKASFEKAQLEMSYATITAPFDGRITDANAELAQYVPAGTALCKLDSTAKAEVEASFAPELLSILPPPRSAEDESRKGFLSKLEFNIESAASDAFRWKASFLRFSEKFDATTRMVTLVLGVDTPYAFAKDDTPHLPLTRGLFCKVAITGPQRPELVIPRQALHDDTVYIAVDDKLVIRKVTVKYSIGTHAIISEGLGAGDVVITSDVVPAVEGMRLKPVIDDTFATEAAKALSK